MNSELIFVTGASGFLCSHVIIQLLQNGYRVRATARGSKVDDLKRRHAKAGDAFDVVNVSDLATDQFPEALNGVDAVIHAGSPLSGRSAPDMVLKSAVEGSLNVIRQAEKAGIKKIIVTGSIGSIMNASGSLSDTEWNPITREQALNDGSDLNVYIASKTLAEQAIWEFAEAHPQLEVTVLNSPFFYGPFPPGFDIPTPDFLALSTDVFIFRLLHPQGIIPLMQTYIDVRDLARAHILAIKAGPAPDGRPKRLPITSPEPFDWKKVLEYIATQRPALKSRLVDSSNVPAADTIGPPDFKRLEAVIGFKENEFTRWQDTVLETVDTIVSFERQWKEAGYNVEIPFPA